MQILYCCIHIDNYDDNDRDNAEVNLAQERVVKDLPRKTKVNQTWKDILNK